jgi:hypothetical protein
LNLLIQKNGETYLKIGDKASYSVSSYSWRNTCWNKYCLRIAKQNHTNNLGVAVRSSATAEVTVSKFRTNGVFPNSRPDSSLRCWRILRTAIKYRHGYGHKIRYCDLCWCTTMVRSDKASSRFFTIDPDTGFKIRS